VVDTVRVFGRTEHDEEDQLLLDVAESMHDVRADEHDRAGLHRALIAADVDPASTGDDVVDLVFGVRLLGIDAADGKDVDAD
jgi:hypothetical protein